MKRIAGVAGAVLAVVLIAGGLWWFQPWAEYSPSRVAKAQNPDNYLNMFRAMDDVFPARAIKAADPHPFPRAMRPLDVAYEWNGETKSLETFMEEASITGLVVIADGQLIDERYRIGETAESPHTSWSVAKSFVATLIGMAIQEGRIASLDDTAETYAEQFAGTDYGATSLRHLLMMSAGVKFDEDYSKRGSDIRVLFVNTFIFNRNVDAQVAQVKRDRPPGQDLHYTSPNTHVLAAVVRAVYGDRPLAEIVQEKIWTPLGMVGDASWSQDRRGAEGIAIGYCCLNARAVDFAKLGQLYLQDGVWNGARLLPEGWVDLVSTPPEPFMQPSEDGPYAPLGYGLHFWVPPDADGEFFMSGVFGQNVWMDRRRRVVVMRTSADVDWATRRAESVAVFRAISQAAAPEPVVEAAETAVEPTALMDDDSFAAAVEPTDGPEEAAAVAEEDGN